MKLAIFGTGYVGLVTGLCFADLGNEVFCIDSDPSKIEKLKQGISPIYEEGIDKLLKSNIHEKRVSFHLGAGAFLDECDVIFIAVGTPTGDDGRANLKYIETVAEQIGSKIKGHKTIVTKSTVPIGTNRHIAGIIEKALKAQNSQATFDMVSNPEFLREGCAIHDCFNPDRILVGAGSPKALAVMKNLYAPFIKNGSLFIEMDIESAEMSKYAANAFLATKISLMNEFSRLCEKSGADIEQVRIALGADHRIGPYFIYAGVGYGGSCFPKDVKALISIGKEHGEKLSILESVEDCNDYQIQRFNEKVIKFVKENNLKKIAVWGLAFKPGTDDLREAPAIKGIEQFLKNNFQVSAYDPVAAENAKLHFAGQFNFETVANQFDVLNGADILVIYTDWKSFKEPNFANIKANLKQPVIFDGRNLYNSQVLKESGFKYFSIGRG